MTDPYKCLRTSTICIGIWNIIYCFIQFGVLGWQVTVVRQLQWAYENRQIPVLGTEYYQARWPGLYAIYTETPERRRVNAMFAIVLICLTLSIIHLVTSIGLIYGAIKRIHSWILPWLFTASGMIIMCTVYAVLWWSGDVFNEQLTMSVAEFIFSLAINSLCLIVVICYYYRLVGKLTSDKPKESPPFHTNFYDYPNNSHRVKYEKEELPPWRTEWNEVPPIALERKLRRRERSKSPHRPITSYNSINLGRNRSRLPTSRHSTTTLSSEKLVRTRSQSPSIRQKSYREYEVHTGQRSPDKERRRLHPPLSIIDSPKEKIMYTPVAKQPANANTLRSKSDSLKLRSSTPEGLSRRKSPQRVSFKSKPKIYQRTPESSVNGGSEVQTVV